MKKNGVAGLQQYHEKLTK
jgi:dynein heavy chain